MFCITRAVHLIFSILLQQHISKLSWYFRYTFITVQTPAPHKAMLPVLYSLISPLNYRGADKSLAWTERKQARKYVGVARDFNNIETRAVIKFPLPPESQGVEGNLGHYDRNISCRVKDLSASLYVQFAGKKSLLLVECWFCHGKPGINFPSVSCVIRCQAKCNLKPSVEQCSSRDEPGLTDTHNVPEEIH